MSTNRFTEQTLGNGLRLILHPDHGTPVASVNVLYHVGSGNERQGLTGMAHLLEHITFENGPNIGRGDYDRHCTSVGGENNAFTTSDITNYYITLPGRDLHLGLWLESQRMSGFTVGQDTFLTQRAVIIEEKHQTVDDVPFADAVPLMRGLSYHPSHPYHWETIGSVEDLNAMELADLRTFYERFYVPSNATLVIAGDIDPDAVVRVTEEYFGQIPPGIKPDPVQSDLSGLCRTGQNTIVKQSLSPFAAVFLGWHAPSLRDPDLRALDLLATVISDGESSRLYRALEYDEEIASETDAFIDEGERGSMFYLYAVGQRPEVTGTQLRESLTRQMETVLREGVSQRELEKAKNIKMTDIVRSLFSVGVRAERLAYSASILEDTARAFTEYELYRSVTAEDLQRVAGMVLGRPVNVVEYSSE